MILEICASSLQAALAAQEGGADRIELCDNLKEGGTTPSPGMIRKVRDLLTIKIYPLIRPRGGDFLYSDAELDIMIQDILYCKACQCDGVVIGALNQDGTVDTQQINKLVEIAKPMGVTFHRAFDRCRDPFQSLEEIIDLGCERVLTSGQASTAMEGIDLITALVKQAGDRIVVMPGSGITRDNLIPLALKTQAKEFHSTAKQLVHSKMEFKNELVRKDGENELTYLASHIQLVTELRTQLNHLS